MTSRNSHPQSRLGCLCAILGCLVGAFLGNREHEAAIKAMRARDPMVFIDFLPAAQFVGFVAGGLLGALIGKIAEFFIPLRSSDQETNVITNDLVDQ